MNMKPSNAHYKNFKKKTSNISLDAPKDREIHTDRFGDLKSKLEKQKESMKKTGRRFREEHSVSTQAISMEVGGEQPKTREENSKSCEVCIGPDAPIKQTISLCEIGLSEKQEYSQSLMRSSRVFEREVKHQKKRNDQLFKFLCKLQLEQFTDGLINNGYDDLETLAQVNVQDLNHMMMRAQQQDRLIQALKNLNLRHQPQQQSLHQSKVLTNRHWRMKTEASSRINPLIQQKKQKSETLQILSRIKTQRGQKGKNQNKSELEMRASFLYSVGSRNWGVQDQIRRACSSCFRVEKQMQKKGDCYYCSKCFKLVAEDLLTISLTTSMDRSYKQERK